jgi:predicted PurR-regulated permease PerM
MFEEGDKHIEYLVSAIVLLILIVGCFFVLRPFMSALLWAIILYFSTWPVFKWWLVSECTSRNDNAQAEENTI